MNLKEKKTLVVGLGITGMATIDFLLSKGAYVRASDSSSSDEMAELLRGKGVEIELGGHTEGFFLWADVIILSPGVPFSLAVVKEALRNGKEVISEVELASRFITCRAKMVRKSSSPSPVHLIAVTGSNGKTTTSTLIAQILERSGWKVFLGGNIGSPMISVVDDYERYDALVIELSSFQLQGVKTFCPDVAVILNVSPNHLDHHKDFDEYVQSKMNICANQNEADWLVYNGEDKIVKGYLQGVKSRKIPFGVSDGEDGACPDGTAVRFWGEFYELKDMRLLGSHNMENSMAAIAVAAVLGCDPDVVRDTIVGFEPLPHRSEYVRDYNGAKFYNDSKSTSPGATLRALESFDSQIVLIAGGKDKGVSFGSLKYIVKERVKLLILIGESRLRMREEMGEAAETVLADTLEEAIDKSLKRVIVGDTVLFSPACSSFDMFNSYEERGNRYKEIVANL